MKNPNFRRLAALLAAAVPLAACANDDGQGIGTTRLPSVDPGAALPSAYSGDLGLAAMPCQIRFAFAAPTDEVDCTVEQSGAPQDWKFTCPAHAFLPIEDDFHFDTNGKLISETTTYPPPPIGTTNPSTYTSEVDWFNKPPCTVLESTPSGSPTKVRCIRPDTVWPNRTYSGDVTITFVYGDLERLSEEHTVETPTGYVDVDWYFTYDDAARRIDTHSIASPGTPMEGQNYASDLYDDKLRIVQRTVDPVGDHFAYTYTYDDAGRLITLTADEYYSALQAGTSYREQRIYDCQ